MAITEHGDAAYVFGWDDTDAGAIATATGLKPQSLKVSGAAEYVAKAENEDGVPAAMAVAPDGRTFTMSGYVVDKTKFDAAKAFTYESRYYVITGRSIDTESKEYRKGEFTGEQHDEIAAEIV